MRVDLKAKVALVTGSAEGIGKAIAIALAANGASVIVNDLESQEEQTTQECQKLGSSSAFIAADVSDRNEVDKLIETAESKFGRIDILVNNAGGGTPGPLRRNIHEHNEAEWHRVLKLNLDSLYYCCRAASSGMVARRDGVIINIASVLGLVPIRLNVAYASAKAAVINFSRCTALELAPFGIRVNAIAPGSILTRRTRELFYDAGKEKLAESLLSHIPLGRPGNPDEIANAALFLASNASSYVTGTVLTVDGGWTAGFAREW
jgi:3-oxoacyl-[acyl-carrier protein] reductase